MNRQQAQFLEDCLRDSETLEKAEEPGQAFDKLIRAVESSLRGLGAQHELARVYFRSHIDNDAIWRLLASHVDRIAEFTSELAYAGELTQGQKSNLRYYATALQRAVPEEDRDAGAKTLSELCMFLRNQPSEEHGRPGLVSADTS